MVRRKAGTLLLRFMMAIGSSVLLSNLAMGQTVSFHFDIYNSTLSVALREYAKISGRQIMFTEDIVSDAPEVNLQGEFTAEAALDRLLMGTDLVADRSPSGALMIHKRAVPRHAPGITAMRSDGFIRTAQADSTEAIVQIQSEGNNAAEGGKSESTSKVDVQEVLVTGSRIVRDGFSSPTPLTVVGEDQINAAARPNIADFVNSLPSLAGSTTPQNSNQLVSAGGAGLNALNLRDLGAVRTLVLLDGQRTVGSQPTGIVDINDFPQQLISRVDVVTGGASAAYGSDALSGVVNFIIDRNFTGLKAEASGGVTTYGDDASYRVAITDGLGFAEGRGHLLISGEINSISGTTSVRDWNEDGWHIMENPNYTATNGQPERLVLPQVAQSDQTPGGIITAGPLRGTAFGPGGVPYKFNYGPLVSDPWMQGGDWQNNDLSTVPSLDPEMARRNFFGRVSYKINDAVEVYVEGSYAHSHVMNIVTSQFNQGNLNVSVDDPFLPQSVAAQARALNISTLTIGTFSGDLPLISTDNLRDVRRIVLGASGQFGMLGSDWSWDAYYEDGLSEVSQRFRDRINANFSSALDAVRDPATGSIVCRSTLTSPNNGCLAYNPFGTGVNSAAVVNYVTGESITDAYFTQQVGSATLHAAAPFSIWAGPVSLALGVEHRKEGGGGVADPISAENGYFVGDQAPTLGSYHVTEEFLETVVPLAKKLPFAKSLELNAAVRLTDYSTSGQVTTWKAGITYTPVDDVSFRATRSRDIRAPDRQELFAAGVYTSNTLIDPFRNNQGTTYTSLTIGNKNLVPEDADTLGVGIIYQPSWAQGFSASIDYYDIKISNAIGTLSPQDIVDRCFTGAQQFCNFITRDASSNIITSLLIEPFNFLSERARGFDMEGTYRIALDSLISGAPGNLVLRGFATHYLENSTDNGVDNPIDTVGSNSGSGPPHWRYLITATYDRDKLSASLTGRGVSAGVYDNSFIQCTLTCPTSTVDNRTINVNHIAGAFYLDLSFSYKFFERRDSGGSAEAFLAVTNLLDRDPPVVAAGPGGVSFAEAAYNPYLYDGLGRTFRFGMRLRWE